MELCEETGSDWAEQKAWFTWNEIPLLVILAFRNEGVSLSEFEFKIPSELSMWDRAGCKI